MYMLRGSHVPWPYSHAYAYPATSYGVIRNPIPVKPELIPIIWSYSQSQLTVNDYNL